MLILFIVLGLIFGSFINVLIHRLPLNESIAFPSSYCPNCKTNINWFNNIPLISFLLLKGKSNCCNNNISIRYPVVELLSSILWIWSYFYIDGLINQIFFIIIVSCLLTIFFTDFNHFYIPFELNLIIFLSALVNLLISNIENIQYHFFSMMVLSIYFLVLLLLSSYLLKKDTMGYGDIILISVVTFWIGLIDGLIVIFFASLFSIIHWLILRITSNNKDIILPFGSTISFAAILIYIIKYTLQIDTNLF
jgi:leader peptidase (prepilin peptidase) / N-methyltransferase